MIPEASNYPESFDSDTNLFFVHDGLRLILAEDYLPGDTTIHVEVNDLFGQFPPTGIITLTEQCSNIDERAISFYYATKTENGFTGIELLPGFTDVAKPKRITRITQNVMASHHNNLKDALIAVEEFVGTKGITDVLPFGDTIEGRTNFLRKLVYTPRAWFTANVQIGLAPLTVEFVEQCFRTGDDPTFVWDFGDQTSSTISVIHASTVVPLDQINVKVKDDDGGKIVKVYEHPGIYNVRLKVYNEFGEDTVEFQNLIKVRTVAPEEAVINFIPRGNQIVTTGDEEPIFDRLATVPAAGFTRPPTVRSAVNTFIDFEVSSGSEQPDDPIVSYTWSLGDDLTHPPTEAGRASYSIGGVYDLRLRTDTLLGSFRITTYEDCIDIIEDRNLWLFTRSGNLAKAHEFGLVSETFKTATQTYSAPRSDTFLDGISNEEARERAKREFKKNTGFAKIGSASSGQAGAAMILWAKGGTPLATQQVGAVQYEGFTDVYLDAGLGITRPWNWAFLPGVERGYLVFGSDPNEISDTNLSNQAKTTINYSPVPSVCEECPSALDSSNYKDGANDLVEHPTFGYTSHQPTHGRFATYRTAWKGAVGYILRNSSTGPFFRLRNFYKTEGTTLEPFVNIRKLPDMPGATKVEGQLVPMADGIFFFSNSGNISAYNDISGTWQTGGPSLASASFRSVQDTTSDSFDDPANTLLAVSDDDRVAYLSYDYSPNAFVKFNGADLTFTNLGSRPSDEQWVMGVF